MVTREEIAKIAKLAKLSVSEQELTGLTASMSEIIAFADTINATTDGDSGFDTIGGLQNAFREDEVTPSFDRELILKNVDGGEDGFFPVRRRM